MNPITVTVENNGDAKDAVTIAYTPTGAVIKTGNFEFTITNNTVTPKVAEKKTTTQIMWESERQIAYRRDAVLNAVFNGGASEYIDVITTNRVIPEICDSRPVIECFYVIDESNLDVDTLITRDPTLYGILTNEESFAQVQRVGNTLRIPTYWWDSGDGYKTCLINHETDKQLEILHPGIVKAFRTVTERTRERVERFISPRSTSKPLMRE